jgi:hypothetical protein
MSTLRRRLYWYFVCRGPAAAAVAGAAIYCNQPAFVCSFSLVSGTTATRDVRLRAISFIDVPTIVARHSTIIAVSGDEQQTAAEGDFSAPLRA